MKRNEQLPILAAGCCCITCMIVVPCPLRQTHSPRNDADLAGPFRAGLRLATPSGCLFSIKILSYAHYLQAKSTKALHLSCMGFETVPASVWRLTDLVRLDLGHNDITELPSDIGNLTALQELWLNGASLVTSVACGCVDDVLCRQPTERRASIHFEVHTAAIC